MVLVHFHQTAQLLVLYLNFLIYAAGFGVPSPVDLQSMMSNLESFNHLSRDLIETSNYQHTEVMISPNTAEIKDHVVTEIKSIYTAIKQATVTKRVDNALASILAEAASGATGALISRKSSSVMTGVIKRDSLTTKMKTTGAFFGARFGAEGIFIHNDSNFHRLYSNSSQTFSGVTRVLGIPKPLSLLLAAIVGSLVSTNVKAEGRLSDQTTESLFTPPKERKAYYFVDGEFIMNMDIIPNPNKVTSYFPWSGENFYNEEFETNMKPTSYNSANFFSNESYLPNDKSSRPDAASKSSMTFPEVAGDIGKWMIYDNLITNCGLTSGHIGWTDYDRSALHVLFGTVAAVAGKCIQDLTPLKDRTQSSGEPQLQKTNYSQAALEGGVLFGTYRTTLSFLNSVVPDDWNKVFPFESALENVEQMIL